MINNNNQALSTRIEQKQVTKPQVIQLLRILQLPRQELLQEIRQEMEQNIFLEENELLEEETEEEMEIIESEEKEIESDLPHIDEMDYDYFYHSDWKTGYNFSRKSKEDEEFNAVDIYSQPTSFREYMLRQVHLNFDNPKEMEIAEYITDSLSDEGLLDVKEEEIMEKFSIDNEYLERILKKYRFLSPVGVASRNHRESLLTQLEYDNKKDSLAYKIIDDLYEDFIKNKLYKIKVKYQKEDKEIEKAIEEIRKLNPKPANGEWGKNSNYVIPDIIIEKQGDDFVPMLNLTNFPEIHINKKYLEMLKNKDKLSKEEIKKLKEMLNKAVFYVSGIHRRHQTLLSIAERIVQLQKDFFIYGVSALKPMILSDIASYLNIHESTVSRAIDNKYMDTPIGLFPFKFFFSRGISIPYGETSTRNIKDLIKNIIEEENKSKPYTDSEIMEILKTKNIKIARRTVAKYREQLGILSAPKRKKYFKEDK